MDNAEYWEGLPQKIEELERQMQELFNIKINDIIKKTDKELMELLASRKETPIPEAYIKAFEGDTE
jgi:hypothetical protein